VAGRDGPDLVGRAVELAHAQAVEDDGGNVGRCNPDVVAAWTLAPGIDPSSARPTATASIRG
jgi:hypothetical protein